MEQPSSRTDRNRIHSCWGTTRALASVQLEAGSPLLLLVRWAMASWISGVLGCFRTFIKWREG